jgi:hypothetical protein
MRKIYTTDNTRLIVAELMSFVCLADSCPLHRRLRESMCEVNLLSQTNSLLSANIRSTTENIFSFVFLTLDPHLSF